jgi:exonuclease VII large subunit
MARLPLMGAASRLRQVAALLPRQVAQRLIGERRQLAGVGERLAATAPRRVAEKSSFPTDLLGRIAVASSARLRQAEATVQGWERLCTQLLPERTLERGFTITRDAAGTPLKDAGQVGVDAKITTELATGRLISRVEGI